MMGNILACVMAVAGVGAGIWIWLYERKGTDMSDNTTTQGKDDTKVKGKVAK